jgi:hypothetical protein
MAGLKIDPWQDPSSESSYRWSPQPYVLHVVITVSGEQFAEKIRADLRGAGSVDHSMLRQIFSTKSNICGSY